MTMGIPAGLWGEGSSLTAAQQAAEQASAQPNESLAFNVGDNTQGPAAGPGYDPYGMVSGNNLASNEISNTSPGVSSGLYGNAINLANAQAANYQQKGNAALGTAAPTINNPNAAATMRQLGGVNDAYGHAERSLAATAAGGGINAGQAQYQGAQDQNIAAALGAAGSKGGNVSNTMGAASSGLGSAVQSGAATRGQQIAGAQSGLAGAYAGQSGVDLGTYGAQQQLAQQQAQVQGAQNAQNDQQMLNLYGLSQAQQQAAATDLQQYNTGAVATMNAGTSHQQTTSQQLGTEIGTGLQVGGAVAAAAL